MRVDVIWDGEAALARVADAENLKSLAVVVGPGVSDEAVADALTAAGLGTLNGEHAWLSVAALRNAGEDSDAWRSGFMKMIEFACSHGWTNDRGDAVRAHLERPVTPRTNPERPRGVSMSDPVETIVETEQGRISAVGYGWDPEAGGAEVPIVLLHSLGTSSRLWEATVPLLRAAGRPVVTLDFYGHGRSEDPNWVPSVLDHADAVESVLDALRIDRFHLAGTSLGGIVAIELAFRPDFRGDAIVLNGTPGWHLENQRMARLRSLSQRLGPSGLPSPEMTAGGTVRDFDDTERKARAADLTRCGPWFLHTMWAIASYDLAARLPRIDVRTLILMGDGDFHMATSYVLEDGIRRSTPGLIANAGHLTPYDAPEEIAEHLLAFF